MNYVVEGIYIGDMSDGVNVDALEAEKIDILMNLDNTYCPSLPLPHLTRIHMPIDLDRDLWIIKRDIAIAADILYSFLRMNIEQRKATGSPLYKILVHCLMGMERSCGTVALALCNVAIEDDGVEFFLPNINKAYDFVATKRPQTIRHMEWFE